MKGTILMKLYFASEWPSSGGHSRNQTAGSTHHRPSQPNLDARHQTRPNKLHSRLANAGGTKEALSNLVVYWYTMPWLPVLAQQ